MRSIKPKVTHETVTVRAVHPLAVGLAVALGMRDQAGINGGTGSIIAGMPTPTNGGKFSGYGPSQQIFKGWDPRKVAAGSIRATPGGLPGTQSPIGYNNPVLNSIMNAGLGPDDVWS